MKYVVDTCILNKLAEGLINEEELPNDGEFIASHIQIDEINNTSDKEKRIRLLNRFHLLVDDNVLTESAVAGISKCNLCKASDDNLFSVIKRRLDMLNKSKKSNANDALIAEIAIKNNYTLLTTDRDLKTAARENGCVVQCWKV